MTLSIFRRTGANDPFRGIALGDRARCTLTGFEGIVLGRSEHLTGCNQVFLLPGSDKSNEYKEGVWFDVERIAVLERAVVQVSESRTGADIPPPRMGGRTT